MNRRQKEKRDKFRELRRRCCSDPVPADILEEDNKSVFEYLAEKYGIGEDDTDGR